MLDERLRKHTDSIAPPVELTEVFGREVDLDDHVEHASTNVSLAPARPVLEQETASQGSRRLVWFAGAAAAMLVLLAGGLLLAASRNEPTPLVAGEGGSAQLPTLPAGVANTSWRKVTEPFAPIGAGNAVQVHSATAADGVAWAAGFEWRIEFTNDRIDARKRGAIWRSVDGEAWVPVEGNFGSLELPGGNWAPSGIAFEHIVATTDGAIWAFGNEYRDTITPVGFRSFDGGEWVALELPSVEAEQSQLVSVAAEGTMVLAVIIDDGPSMTEQTRVLTSADGSSWETVSEQNTSATTGFAAALDSGKVIEITNEVLPGDADGPQQLVVGPGFLVTAGVDSVGEVFESTDETDRTQVGRLWHSLDGDDWTELTRIPRPDVLEVGPQLFRHQSGVLAAIQWTNESDAGVSLFDVDKAAGVADLGRLPSATFVDMFVLDDTLFIIGSESSAALDETTEEDASIWVAEPSNSKALDDRAASGEALDAASESLAIFYRCLEILEVPDQPDLPVNEGYGGRIIVQHDSPDPRIRLCKDATNEEIDLRESGTSTSGLSPISAEQSDALSDGVTDAEYEAAWQRFELCVERGGGELAVTEYGEGGYSFVYPDSSRFIHDACYPWHFARVDSIWQSASGESERAESRAAFLELVANARTTVAANARRLWQSEFVAEMESCQTTYGDRWWITTFDSMPQPLCLVVGEDHDLDFWNKGYETAIVAWPGEERTLVSDSSFETGRLGDTFDAGKHVVEVEPYGEVTLFVMSEELSIMATMRDKFAVASDVLRGLPATEVAEMLGSTLEIVNDPRDGCSIARIVGDPYSPQFILLGDSTVEGSVVVDLVVEGASC